MDNLPAIKCENHQLVGLHSDLSNEAYQKSEGLSRSAITKVLNKSPLHYITDLTQKDEEEEKPSPALLFGQAFHDAILLPDLYKSNYAFEQKLDKRTKDGKETFQQFLRENEGKVIVPPHNGEPANITIDKAIAGIMSHPFISKLFDPRLAKFEHSIFWIDKETGLLCKCRPDLFINLNNDVFVIDVKTTADASEPEFLKSIINLEYHIQAAHYLEGIKSIIPDARNYIFGFLAIEKTEPFDFALYNLDSNFQQIGKYKRDKGLETIAKCLQTNEWPGYPKKMITLECPQWLMKKEI